MMAVHNLCVVTFNLRGLNQGLDYLQDLLICNDVVCIQEHWLSSHDDHKLTNINTEFNVIASYAIDEALGKGILRGRPYGGIAIFVRATIMNNFAILHVSDRCIALRVNNLIICNVYMPCNDFELFTSIIGTISDLIHSNAEC